MLKSTLFSLVMLIGLFAFADEKPKTDKDTAKKKETLADKIKSKHLIEGLFTLYQDTTTGEIQMFVKKDQLSKEFIYQSFSMGGPPSLFLNQNMIRRTYVFSIAKNFDKIEFLRENTRFYYNPKLAISKSANADVSRAKFYSTKVVIEDSTGYLIDVDDLFKSQLMDPIKPNFRHAPGMNIFNLGSLNKGKSHYLKLRSFPENTDVVVSLTYDNATPKASGTKHVTDARFIEVKMQHSFLAMPDNDYKPRFDDPRIGYFTEIVDDVSTYEYPNYRDLIHRWHLVKKDPNAALSEPVKPITWWIENTTPEEYRDIMLEAGRKWNTSFEKAGFKNAVVMKMMPDDAEWDPADIRYNVIRWVASDLGFAIGPSFVNPRTGEILGADITIDFGMLLFTLNEQQTSSIGYEVHDYQLDFDVDEQHSNHCTMAQGKKAQQALATAMLHANSASDLELKKLADQFMTELVLHEMGHTMGLAHNMKASQMLSLEEAHDTSITRKIGTTASIMDYTIVNVHSDPSKQGDYYSTVPGPYDHWAIEYAYTPYKSSQAEATGLAEIVGRSSDPKLDYGNDADIVSAYGGIDPRVMTWDMSSDVIVYSQDRYKGINNTIVKLSSTFVEDDASYQKLVFMYYFMQRGRSTLARSVSRYIGGVYVNRTYPGQKSTELPYTPVPYDYQKKAMQFLADNVYAPKAFEADAHLYPYLQRQRRGWYFGGNTEDPKLQNLVLGIQYGSLSFILSSTNLNRINNSSLYGNTYSVTEVMSDLTDACFKADWSTEVNLFRQNLQVSMVDLLIKVAENKRNKFDNASSAAARAQLKTLHKKLRRKKGKKGLTRAHRAQLSDKIKLVFED